MSKSGVFILILLIAVGFYFYSNQDISLPSFCSGDEKLFNNECIPDTVCGDNTSNYQCSTNKPFKCINESLIESATECGCEEGFKPIENICEEIKYCRDNTPYGECSTTIPKYCQDGALIYKASVCGCEEGFIPDKERCISKYKINPKDIYFEYTLRGESNSIKLTVYGELNSYLASLPRTISYYEYEPVPTKKDFLERELNNKIQEPYLVELSTKIKALDLSNDDKARVAISLVQNIPYDQNAFKTNNVTGKYPYQVLYTNTGVCGEKSTLLIFLLKELGYETAYIAFDPENHAVAGIKCADQYDYRDTGYCFIETTRPTIPTYKAAEYTNVGYIMSIPIVVKLSEGIAFETIGEEHLDALNYEKINKMGPILEPSYYAKWLALVEKYGLG
ncbi:MAG: hypothetical protein ABIB43_04770 [archaeon]